MTGEPMASNAAAETRCPVCNSAVVSWRQKQTADETFTILMCCACRYAFVSPRPSLSQLMDFYAKQGHGERAGSPVPLDLEFVHEAERRYPNSSLDAKRIVKTIDRLTPDCSPARKRFLDVGCGCGFFSLEAQTLGFAVTSLELAETERRLTAQMTGHRPLNLSFEDFKANAESFDAILMSQILEHAHDTRRWIEKAVSVVSPEEVERDAFDLVLCSSVIEYVDDAEVFLRQLRSYLKLNGVLLITLPNRTGFLQLLNRYAVRWLRSDCYALHQRHRHTKQTIRDLMNRNGFTVEALSCPIGLPLLKSLGLGELHLCVARRQE